MFSALQIAKTLFIFQTSSSLSCLLWSSLLRLHCFFFSSKRQWPPSSCPTTITSCFNKLLLLFHATLQQPMQQVSVLFPHFLMPRVFVCGESSFCSCFFQCLVFFHLLCKWSKFLTPLLYRMCVAGPHVVSWSLLVKFAVGVRCSPWWFVCGSFVVVCWWSLVVRFSFAPSHGHFRKCFFFF